LSILVVELPRVYNLTVISVHLHKMKVKKLIEVV